MCVVKAAETMFAWKICMFNVDEIDTYYFLESLFHKEKSEPEICLLKKL